MKSQSVSQRKNPEAVMDDPNRISGLVQFLVGLSYSLVQCRTRAA